MRTFESLPAGGGVGAEYAINAAVGGWFAHTQRVLITAVPITKLFAWGEGDGGGHVLRDTTAYHIVRDYSL